MAHIDGLLIRASYLEAFREVELKFVRTGDEVRLERVWYESVTKMTGVPYDPSLSRQENFPRMWANTLTLISREEFAIASRLVRGRKRLQPRLLTRLACPIHRDSSTASSWNLHGRISARCL